MDCNCQYVHKLSDLTLIFRPKPHKHYINRVRLMATAGMLYLKHHVSVSNVFPFYSWVLFRYHIHIWMDFLNLVLVHGTCVSNTLIPNSTGDKFTKKTTPLSHSHLKEKKQVLNKAEKNWKRKPLLYWWNLQWVFGIITTCISWSLI